ncbi:deoxyribose-phosphate aldolase [Salinispira pacifica]
MDRNVLIDRIVAEVVTRLGDRTASGSQTGTGAPGAGVSGSQAVRPGVSSAGTLSSITPQELAKYIDHTLLKPESPDAAFDKLCEEAARYRFFSVCVNSSRVSYVARKLQGTGVKVCSVVGFPLGSMTARSKAFETREAISDGAAEIDMVINVGKLKSKDYKTVEEDIRAVRRATRANTILKVIIETVFLSQDEKVMACEIAKKAGADFVKTSTGFLGGGATVEDIALMRRVVGKDMGVKASGGIRTQKQALEMIGAGATRIGAGAGVALVTGQQGSGNY